MSASKNHFAMRSRGRSALRPKTIRVRQVSRVHTRIDLRPRRRLLYVATALSLLAFGVSSALQKRNCPEGGLRLDSGVTCDYTVLKPQSL